MIAARFAAATVLALSFSQSEAHVPAHGPQHELLKPYEDFILNMRLKDGSTMCCNHKDGIGNLAEKKNADGSYTVTLPAGYMGLTEEMEVDIPANRVLSFERAEEVCDLYKDSTTCVAPPFNILWIRMGGTGVFSEPYVYCYWPWPKFADAGDQKTLVVVMPASFVVDPTETILPTVQSTRTPAHPHP